MLPSMSDSAPTDGSPPSESPTPGVPGAAEQVPWRRETVSFIRRGGRLTERQQRAWDESAKDFVVDVPRGRTSTSVDPGFVLDFEQLFGRAAPVVMEVGSGRGESLVHAATEHPDVDFLALEVYVPGVAQTLVTMRHVGVTNVRLAVVNAPEALSHMVPAQSLDELRLWFPDPWHKKRHHKRRLVGEEFAQLVHRVLKPHGVWRMATDWQDYADHMHEVLTATQHFHYSGSPDDRFSGRPITRFEQRGIDADREIVDLSAIRLDSDQEDSNA